MSVLSSIKKKMVGIKRKMFDGFYSQTYRIAPTMSTAAFLSAFKEVGWLFACVSKISQSVADSEWKAQIGDKVVNNSRALELLKKPNPFMSMYDFLWKYNAYMDTTGKAFIYIVKDRIGRPQQLWLINPIDMWIVPDKDNFIKGFIYQAGAEEVPLSTEEVIFINYPDLTNPYTGAGPAQAAANALDSDKYAAKWNTNFFYNNAEPPGILNISDDVDDDTYDALVENWNDRHRGTENAKKIAIIKGGQVTYTAIQVNPKDMDFQNLRKMNRDEILGTYGIPKSVLGITEDVNRANAETAEYTYAKNVVRPRLRLLQEKLNNQYMKLFGEEDIELKFTDPVPENKEFIKSVIESQTDKSITKNEARQLLNKIIGTQYKDLPDGNIIYQPINLQPMGTPMPTAQSKPTTDNNNNSGNELDEGGTQEQNKAIKKNFISKAVRKKVAIQIQKNNETRQENFLKLAEPLQKEFFNFMQQYLNKMKADVVKKVESGNKDPVDLEKWNKALQEKIIDLYINCFKTGGQAVVNEFKSIGNYVRKDLNVSFNFKDPKVKTKIADKVNKSKIINETTKENIRQTIARAYESDEGFSIKDIAKQIADCYEFSDTRATCIAQTETLSSLNQATIEGYKQNSDLIDGKAWLPTYFHTRPSHQQAGEDYSENSAIPVNDNFVVGGCECECPGDGSLPPEEVVNCACCMSPVVNVKSDENNSDNDAINSGNSDIIEDKPDNYFEGLDLSNEANKTLIDVHKDLLEYSEEHHEEELITMDTTDGTKGPTVKGEKSQVVFTKDLIDYLNNAEDGSLILSHNHPGSSSFSDADLSVMSRFKSLKAITVQGENGTRYMCSIGKGKRPNNLKDISKDYIRIKNEFFDKYRNMVIDGTLTPDEAWYQHSHETITELAKQYKWDYRRIEP